MRSLCCVCKPGQYTAALGQSVAAPLCFVAVAQMCSCILSWQGSRALRQHTTAPRQGPSEEAQGSCGGILQPRAMSTRQQGLQPRRLQVCASGQDSCVSGQLATAPGPYAPAMTLPSRVHFTPVPDRCLLSNMIKQIETHLGLSRSLQADGWQPRPLCTVFGIPPQIV